MNAEQLESIHTALAQQVPALPYFLIRGSNIHPIEEWTDADATSAIVAFIDPSTQLQNPGWPLRNLLTFLRTIHPNSTQSVRVLCWRDTQIPRDGVWKSIYGVVSAGDAEAATTRPKAVGWELNIKGKAGARLADLAPMMDPARLANQAVDLNLKLMRWRIMPELDLEKIAGTRCLLLGAGTLGCYVSRCLMVCVQSFYMSTHSYGLQGWGVRTITLVDSGKVSFSNPVRQPLFQFDDCLNGGRPKAECAAERLRQVWPGLVSLFYDARHQMN